MNVISSHSKIAAFKRDFVIIAAMMAMGLTSGVLGITAGSSHACVLLTNGIKCWGASAEGEVGDGSTTTRATPTDVAP